jgi:hypothetical protein
MTAQLEATTAHQVIPIPTYAGQSLTSFAVRARLYMGILAYITNRQELMIIAYGPLLATAMAPYIHLIHLLPENSCRCQSICWNVLGPEDTTLNPGYVDRRRS